MATIRWTDTAEDAYLALLQTVYSNSTQAALLLDDKLEQLLSRLRQFKYHCPPLEKIPGFRRCVVIPTIGLVYDVSGEVVTIVSVFDTRMDHPFN